MRSGRGSTHTKIGYPAIEMSYPEGWDRAHYPSLWNKNNGQADKKWLIYTGIGLSRAI